MDAAMARTLHLSLPPAPEAVTLGCRSGSDGDGPASYSSYTLMAKGMRPKAARVNVGGVWVVRRTRHWQFWLAYMEQAAAVGDAALPCPAPQPDDRIADGEGRIWTIDSSDERLFGECWLIESTQENT